MQIYHAEVTRDGKFWLIRIPELDRSTQALSYRDVATMAGELVKIMTSLGGEEYDLRLNLLLPSSVQDHPRSRRRPRRLHASPSASA